jgi:hypothetical protein
MAVTSIFHLEAANLLGETLIFQFGYKLAFGPLRLFLLIILEYSGIFYSELLLLIFNNFLDLLQIDFFKNSGLGQRKAKCQVPPPSFQCPCEFVHSCPCA